MATTKKNSKKAKRKPSLLKKIKALVPRKKATPGRAYKNALKAKKSTRLNPAVQEDPAHAAGHRHLSHQVIKTGGKKNRPQDESAMNNMAKNDRIARNVGNRRRVISGAAIGKHGRQS